MIDTSSQSKVVLSNLGKRITSITIISDSSWPSWLYVLDLFLESSPAFKKASVFVTSNECHNLFGTSRKRTIVWELISFQSRKIPKLLNSITSSSIQLFSGSLPGFMSLLSLLSSQQRSKLNLIAVLLGNIRLRNLSKYDNFTWITLDHSTVGGCSSGKIWCGYTRSFRDSSIASPKYCPSAMMDVLEFAPKRITVTPASALPSLGRSSSLIQSTEFGYAWNCTGLYPFHDRLTQSTVVTPTPFVPTKWCIRELTAREMARIFDVPVDIESRLAKLFPSQ